MRRGGRQRGREVVTHEARQAARLSRLRHGRWRDLDGGAFGEAVGGAVRRRRLSGRTRTVLTAPLRRGLRRGMARARGSHAAMAR
jgi:hypothetical protein